MNYNGFNCFFLFLNFNFQRLKVEGIKVAKFEEVIKIYHQVQLFIKKENDDFAQADTLNAFVSMGGNEDKSGYVTSTTIITVKFL